jgi:hypothetical protein
MKATYIQLQETDTPYDQDKIQSADKPVIDQHTKAFITQAYIFNGSGLFYGAGSCRVQRACLQVVYREKVVTPLVHMHMIPVQKADHKHLVIIQKTKIICGSGISVKRWEPESLQNFLHVSRQNVGQIIVLTNCCQNVYLQFIVI